MNFYNKVLNIANSHKKEFLLSGVAQLIYMSQSLCQNKIFAVCFDTEGFGRWALLMSVYTALDQGIYSVANEYRVNGNDKSLFTKVSYTYLLIFFFYIIFSIFYVYLKPIPVDISVSLFMLYTITEVLKNTYTLIDNAYRNRMRVMVLRIVDFVFRLFVFLFIAQIGYFTINNVLLTLIVTNLLAIAFLREYFPYFKLTLFREDYLYFYKSIFGFSLPLLAWALFGWLQNMIGRWYLNMHVDETGVALYTMLVSLSYFVPYAFYSVVSTYIMPIIYSKEHKLSAKFLFFVLMGSSIVLLAYLFCIILFGENLVLLLADNKYLEIVKYLPYTTASSILYILSMLSTVEIYRAKATKKLLVPTILPGLIMSTVGYYLIMRWHLFGAVVNYALGQILYSIIVLPLGVKSTK